MARIAAVFSLTCGAVLDLGICRYAGKGQSELGMLRTLWSTIRPGDKFLMISLPTRLLTGPTALNLAGRNDDPNLMTDS